MICGRGYAWWISMVWFPQALTMSELCNTRLCMGAFAVPHTHMKLKTSSVDTFRFLGRIIFHGKPQYSIHLTPPMAPPITLHDAVRSDELETITTCLKNHPTAKQADLDECLTPAMQHGSLSTIKLLLHLGAKLNRLSLMKAGLRAEPAVFELLMDFGLDINSVEFGLPAVYRAVNHEDLLRWLLDHGADPNTRPERRSQGASFEPMSALAAAARLPNPGPLRLLLTYGAVMDPEAIFWAIGVNRGTATGIATMEVLSDHGADLNYVSVRYSTPLNFAISKNRLDKVKFLLDHGADPETVPAKWDKMAIELAKEKDSGEMYELLQDARRSEKS
ncbi:ankyrin repeat-containing domain protein [Paraphoma chrysanthemicola]|nr:ankyrin repeat-containing domain protein [Paraphoma chrysanthemicola]